MKAADLTDPSVAQKLKNSFISQQVNTTTNKSPDMAWLWVQEKNLTASEQVEELAGWMYGSDAAKKMATIDCRWSSQQCNSCRYEFIPYW